MQMLSKYMLKYYTNSLVIDTMFWNNSDGEYNSLNIKTIIMDQVVVDMKLCSYESDIPLIWHTSLWSERINPLGNVQTSCDAFLGAPDPSPILMPFWSF